MTHAINLSGMSDNCRWVSWRELPRDPSTLSPLHSLPDATDAALNPHDRPRVAFAIVTKGVQVSRFVQSLLVATMDDAHGLYDSTVFMHQSGPYMDQGRNVATMEFFTSPALRHFDWLFFLDDDLEFTPYDVHRVVTAGRHLCGGAYASPHDGKKYVVAYRWGDGMRGDAVHGKGHTLTDLTEEDLDAMPPTAQPVDAIGTGFLAIHRSVIETFPRYYMPPQPWFAELTVENPTSPIGVHYGEDMTFCLRAAAIGIQPHVHPAVRLIHYKTVGIEMGPHPSLRVE